MGGRIGPPIRDEFDRMLRAFILSEIERERERQKRKVATREMVKEAIGEEEEEK